MFSLLETSGLKIKLTKCHFFKEQIQFLGYSVTRYGIQVDMTKEEKINSFPVPKSKKDIKRFLGFTSYYRKFVPNYSQIIQPMAKLLKNNVEYKWEEEQETAFENIKRKLLSKIILSFPDYNKEFVVTSDASDTAISAALFQEKDERLCPISFASKILSDTEKRYSICKREALAVMFALKKFRYVVKGYKVTILTDAKSVVYLFKNKLPEDSAMARYSMFCQDFRPNLRYFPGKFNNFANMLSRQKFNMKDTEDLLQDLEDRFEAALYYASEVLPPLKPSLTGYTGDKKALATAQRVDPIWSAIIAHIEGTKSQEILKIPDGLQFKNFIVHEDVLYYVRKESRLDVDTKRIVVVLPDLMVDEAIMSARCPIDKGHVGRERTLTNAEKLYVANGLKKKVRQFVENCEVC